MKKILLASFLILSISVLGQQQSISLQAGMNITHFIGGFSDNTSLRLAPAGGADYSIITEKNILLGVGLHYAPRGFTLKFIGTDENGNQLGEYKSNYNYNYLGIPIRFGLVKGDKVKFIPYAAVVPSVLMSAKNKSSFFISPAGEPFEEELKKPFSQFDIGLMIGMELEFPLTAKLGLFPAVSIHQSITSFDDKNIAKRRRHTWLFIGLGLKYHFSKLE